MTVTINFHMLWYYKYEEVSSGSRKAIEPTLHKSVKQRIFIMSLVLLVMTCLEFLGWIITKATLINKIQWRKLVLETAVKERAPEDEEDPKSKMTYNLIKPAEELPLSEVRKILRLNGPDDIRFKLKTPGKRDFGHLIVKLEYYWISFTFLLNDYQFRYYLAFIMLTALGMQISHIFFSF